MTGLDPVPPELRTTYQRWTARDRPQQPSSKWFPHRWTTRLPESAPFLYTLPNPISRRDVAEQFVDAHRSEEATLHAFLAAMIWGHGRNGYGAYRTSRVLEAHERANQWLREALEVTRSAGGPAGFDYLARHRIKGLGVAFATKFLYFCVADETAVTAAPILDSVVCGWLATNTGWQPRLDWRLEDYQRYCELVTRWSNQLAEPAGTIEYLIFASGIGTTSQWAGSPDGAQYPTAVRSDGGGTAVLAALDDVADAFEALQGEVSPDDAEDFDRGLRALRRIVLARAEPATSAPAPDHR